MNKCTYCKGKKTVYMPDHDDDVTPEICPYCPIEKKEIEIKFTFDRLEEVAPRITKILAEINAIKDKETGDIEFEPDTYLVDGFDGDWTIELLQ